MQYRDKKLKTSEIPKWIKRYINNRQEVLEKICKKVWTFTNRNNEQYIFGLFLNPKDEEDTTIVTLGYYERYACNYLSCW